MAAKVEPPPSRLQRPTTLHDFPDKLLRRILQLLIDSPLWIVRAAATCRQWRRLIAHWSFRSTMGYRQDHRLAGSYHNTRNRRGPVFVPSSPDDVDGRHFSLDFLPGGRGAWELVDSRCNMLLLAKWKTGWRRHCFPVLLVCEPLKRRYQLIPPMEEVKRHRCVGVFLYGCSSFDNGATWGRNGARIPKFKMVCLLYQEHDGVRDDHGRAVGTVVTCVFDLFRACDRVLLHRKPGWCLRRKERLDAPVHLHGPESLRLLGRSGSSVFWSIKEDEESLLSLSSDGYKKIHRLPEIARRSTALRFIDHGSDYTNIRVICLQGSDLRVLVAPWHLDGEWVIQRSISLLEAARRLTRYTDECFISGGMEIVSAYGHGRSIVVAPVMAKTFLFTVDLQTMDVAKWKYKLDENTSIVSYPCELPWPPDLRACKVLCTRCKRSPCSPKCNYH